MSNKVFLSLILSFGLILSGAEQAQANAPASRVKSPAYKIKATKKRVVVENGKPFSLTEFEYGGVDVAGSAIDWMQDVWSGYLSATFTVLTSPSGDFSFDSRSTCIGTLSGTGNCIVAIKFSPTSEGFKTSTATIRKTYVSAHNTTIDDWVFTMEGYGIPPVDEPECKVCGSVIGATQQTLGESVDIVGTPYSLVYNSRYSGNYLPPVESYSFSSAFSFGNAGWSFSPHKQYNIDWKRLFSADGTVSLALGEWLDPSETEIGVADSEGEEIYIFDPNGRHLRTLSSLTGVTIYTFGYDSSNRLTSITDRFGNVTTIARNSSGITSVTAPFGQVTLVGSSSNRINYIENPNSERHSFTYKSSSNLLQTFQKPGLQTSTFTYDSNGRLTKDEANGGNLWDLVRSSSTISLTSKLGRATTYQKSRNSTTGQLGYVETAPSGFAKTFTETSDKSTHQVTPVDEETVTTTEDQRFPFIVRQPAEIKYKIGTNERVTNRSEVFDFGANDPNDYFDYLTRTITYETSGRSATEVFNLSTGTTTLTSSEGQVIESKINSLEMPVSIKVGNDVPMTLQYDSFGRVVESKQGIKNTKNYTYYSNGYLNTITNQRGEVTKFEYDAAGRVVKSKNEYSGSNQFVLFSYDSNGNLTGVTPPDRPIHTFVLNSKELVETYSPPTLSGVSPKNTTYSYNNDKQMTLLSRPDGKQAAYQYHATKGYLEQITTPLGNYLYSHSSTVPGQITDATSPYGIKNVYEYYGPVLKSDQQVIASSSSTIGKVSFGFDSDHRTASRTITDSSNTSFVRNITQNDDDVPVQYGDMTLDYEYPSGRLWKTNLDRVSDSRTYDAYGNLETYTAKYTPSSGPDVVLYSYTLSRDSMSRINGVTEVIRGVTSVSAYEYDNAGRLVVVKKNGNVVASYGYDLNGNRNTQTINGTTITPTYDDQDRLLSFGGKVFSYNNNGDLTGSSWATGASESFAYDVFGNLSSMTNSKGRVSSYVMDASDRRVGKSVSGSVTQRFLYQDQLRVAAELSSSGAMISEFVYASERNVPDYMIKGGTKYFVVSNHLGSPRLIVNAATGAVVQRVDYDVWGKVTLDSSTCFQPFGFAGGLRDPDHYLVRFGARDYDPEVGRWTSKDPILFDGGDTNLYGYAFSDPVNFIDPSGLRSDIDFLPPGTVASQGANNMPNMNGAYTVSSHGNENLLITRFGNISPVQLANLIRLDPTYRSGQQVVLNVCRAGSSENGFAQQLSNALGAPVFAANGDVAVWSDGSSTVLGGGQWINFKPKPSPLR